VAGGQKEEFLDKAVDSVESKLGMGNSQTHRAQNEKITDKARDLFEKKTGKNVPNNVSN